MDENQIDDMVFSDTESDDEKAFKLNFNIIDCQKA